MTDYQKKILSDYRDKIQSIKNHIQTEIDCNIADYAGEDNNIKEFVSVLSSVHTRLSIACMELFNNSK